jgi:hypothetical protein
MELLQVNHGSSIVLITSAMCSWLMFIKSHNVVEVLHMICFLRESANLGMFPSVDCFHYAIQDGIAYIITHVYVGCKVLLSLSCAQANMIVDTLIWKLEFCYLDRLLK